MLDPAIYSEVRKLEIESNRIVNSYFSGEYQSAFKGRGIEFEEVRPYVEGDEVRSIDWNVSARSNQLFVKVYKEERELTIFFVVDLSASMYFGSKQSKKDLMQRLVALLSLVAMKNNDRVGLLICSDQVEKVIMPRKGRKHVLVMIRELLAYEPKQGKTNLKIALETISKILKKRSVVFLFSDFLTGGYQQALEIAARKHDLVPIIIRDNWEKALPNSGFLRLEDLENGSTQVVNLADEKYLTKYRQEVSQKYKQLSSEFLRHKLDHLELISGAAYLPKLTAFFQRRIHRRGS